MDFGGIVLVGGVSSLAGGTVRNLFLLNQPPWILNPWLFLPVLVAVIFTIISRQVESAGRLVLALDTFGLAVATVSSTEFALRHGARPIAAIPLGLIGGVVGGLLRDVLAQVPPVLLHRETIGTSCFAGAAAIVLLNEMKVNNIITIAVGGCLIVLIRELSIHFAWDLPRLSPRDKSS